MQGTRDATKKAIPPFNCGASSCPEQESPGFMLGKELRHYSSTSPSIVAFHAYNTLTGLQELAQCTLRGYLPPKRGPASCRFDTVRHLPVAGQPCLCPRLGNTFARRNIIVARREEVGSGEIVYITNEAEETK